jgi:hypothetical protein
VDKIQITDLIDTEGKDNKPDAEHSENRALLPMKKKSAQAPLLLAWLRILVFLKSFFNQLAKIDPGKIKDFLSRINIYRDLREKLTHFYLKRTVSNAGVNRDGLLICWQPVFLILFKVGIAAFVSYRVYLFYPLIGKWLKEGFDFFKLQEIYNFEFPKQPFFDSVASGILLFVIGYHGLFFLYRQLIGLFSVLVVNKDEAKVYYLRSSFVKKELYVFSIPDIALVVLKQNILSRLFHIGTIALQKKSGELIEIRSIMQAQRVVKELSGSKPGE